MARHNWCRVNKEQEKRVVCDTIGMMLLVEVDNTAAIALFKSMGFIRVVNGNSITAHVLL
ncbi:MAG: hypothetical protein K2I07_15980 [Lachnospiraceae bacterium]|nr:hypothetical protein [Lachnospiraceae bacterium]